jgi:DNA-directed RNA polymerase alpha subunit
VNKRNERNTILLLQSVVAATIKLDELTKLVVSIRQEVERSTWFDQSTSHHLAQPIENLELCMRALNYLPGTVKTIGDLCQYSALDLSPAGNNKYIREIQDSLRTMGLVLKP